MPVCRDCQEFFVEQVPEVSQQDVDRLYRAVAEGEPKLEILHMLYAIFSPQFHLSHPSVELRTADLLARSRA